MSFHFASWPLPANVLAGWSTRQSGFSRAPYGAFNLGDHVGEAPDTVAANRLLLRQRLPGQPEISWLQQTHSTVVVNASAVDPQQGQDGSFSTAEGVACCVMTADCLPVFFWSADGAQVAIAHAGWRGLANNILITTLATFRLGSSVSCGIGPAIGPSAFEVGAEVKAAFAGWPNSAHYFQPRADKYLCDLPGLAADQLLAAGAHRVYRSDQCTVNNPEHYYSYRRDVQTGRMANLIWRIAA